MKVIWRNNMSKDIKIKFIGEFYSVSGVFIVSDPCYRKSLKIQAVLDNVKKGKWFGFSGYNEGGTVMELYAFHSSEIIERDFPKVTIEWNEFGKLGTDSGQMGIYEEKEYRNDEIIDFETNFLKKEKWYSAVCETTLSERGSGVMKNSFSSRSGYGDGLYTLFIHKSINEITGVKILFYDVEL